MKKVTKNRLLSILETRHKENPYALLSSFPNSDNFKDIEKASKRIRKAIINKEKITLVGDYDVDGVVSTAIIVDFFEKLNVKIDYIIPDRFKHGYGLSSKIVDGINSGLVITVDNGISAIEASKILKEKNIDLIITDHHTVGAKLPIAYAIVNPKQKDCKFEFKDICGAQVAWYLCAALKKELKLKINLQEYFDLLSLAIIADIMPMKSLNYTMVKKGLKDIVKSNRIAFLKINEILHKDVLNSNDIGFYIAPKLNSAGRLKNAELALRFLLSKTYKEANETLFELEELNEYRKVIQEEIVESAKKKINSNDNCIVVWDENWHEGIIGIVASKLTHMYKKPAIVFSVNGENAKGSARSNNNINLYDILNKFSDLLTGFGGHKNAAGISVKTKNLSLLKEKINQEFFKYKDELYINEEVIGEIDLKEVDLEFISIIEKFEPYGLNNKKPLFKISNITLDKCELIGKNKNHLKLFFEKDGYCFEAIKFGENNVNKLSNKMNLTVYVDKNIFRGNVKIIFLIDDMERVN